jgi:tRNA-dihydrouridine synthase 3
MFGVQLAGGYANQMVPTAEMVRKEIGDGADFVDVNLVGTVFIGWGGS